MPHEDASVKRQRLRRGWTLRDLADRCREAGATVTNSHLSKVERGLVVPNPRLRAVLAELLDLDVIADFERKAS